MWDDRKFNAAHYNFHGNTQDPIFITIDKAKSLLKCTKQIL